MSSNGCVTGEGRGAAAAFPGLGDQGMGWRILVWLAFPSRVEQPTRWFPSTGSKPGERADGSCTVLKKSCMNVHESCVFPGESAWLCLFEWFGR